MRALVLCSLLAAAAAGKQRSWPGAPPDSAGLRGRPGTAAATPAGRRAGESDALAHSPPHHPPPPPCLRAAAPAITSPNNPHFRTLRPAAAGAPLGLQPCDYCKAR